MTIQKASCRAASGIRAAAHRRSRSDQRRRHVGLGIAPAGASRGTREAVELRDGGDALQGPRRAASARAASNARSRRLAARPRCADQAGIDATLIALDGTPNKSRLGGNALIATSLAVLHAAAAQARQPLWQYLAQRQPVQLPLPQVQIFGGGAHAGRRVDVQDFMVIATGARSFDEAMEMTAEVYRCAGELMAGARPLAGVADEGGWWPSFERNEEALDTLVAAIEQAGYTPGEQVAIALDIAASEFGKAGRYRLALEDRSSIPMRCASGWCAGWSATRSSPSRIRWPRTTKPGWSRSRAPSAIGCRWSATTTW
jgi:enolase